MGFGGLGMWEILLIFLVVLLLFGARRLPEIGSSLGKGIREFKSSVRDVEGEFKRAMDDDEPRSAPRPRSESEEPRKLSNSTNAPGASSPSNASSTSSTSENA